MEATKFFPLNYRNSVVSINGDDITVRSNLHCMEELNDWVKIFGENSNTRWIYRKAIPIGTRCVTAKRFVCHHSSFQKVKRENNKKGMSKNSDCPAYIHIKIKLKTPNTMKRDDYIRKDLPAIIKLNLEHNHALINAQVLRFLDSNQKEVFMEYFNDGMGAACAKRYHEALLAENDTSEQDFANARINPTQRSISYWFNEWRAHSLGPWSGAELIEKLKEKQMLYESDGVSIYFQEHPFCVVILTPVMKRSHNLPMASKIVFSDTTNACDPDHHSITFMLTPCPAGVSPLAVIITKGQSIEAYQNGFRLLKNSYTNAFGGQGPAVFMTDNSAAEIEALKITWPESNNYLCIFHILQAIWRWLWDRTHNIVNKHRLILMNSFKKMVYADSFEILERSYTDGLQVGTKLGYGHWNSYISNNYWPIREKWCLCFRDHVTRGHQTNNFAERFIGIFKDLVFSRVKAYNVISLIHFICTVMENSYKQKFQDFANFRLQNTFLYFKKIIGNVEYLNKEDITVLSDSIYMIPSQEKGKDTLYSVDISSGLCSCYIGKFGKICKHQVAVYEFFPSDLANFPPITIPDRYSVAMLALGEKTPDISFYSSFTEEDIEKEPTSPLQFCNRMLPDCITSSSNTCQEGENLQNPDLIKASVDEDTNACIEKEAKEIMDVFMKKVCLYKSPSLSTSLQVLKKRLLAVSSEGSLATFIHGMSYVQNISQFEWKKCQLIKVPQT